MGFRIKGSQLSEAGQELVDRVGPLAYKLTDELGLDMSKMSKADKDMALDVAKNLKGEPADDTLINNARNYLKNQDTPSYTPGEGGEAASPAAAEAATNVSPDATKTRLMPAQPAAAPATAGGRSPADVRADLDNPPAEGGIPALKAGATAKLFEDSKGLVPRQETQPVPAALSANTATPEELDNLASNLKRGAAATAALAGGAVVADQATKSSEPAAPVPGNATTAGTPSSPYTHSGNGKDMGPAAPVKPGGNIDPDFVTHIKDFVAKPYTGPAEPKDSDYKTIGIRDAQGNVQKINPTQYMADAERQMVASVNKLGDAYKAEHDTLKQRELFEGIVNALGHLAAGWYGQHYGVDMSGTKFDVTDWVAQQDALRRKYDTLTGMEKDKLSAAKDTKETAQRELEQAWSRNLDLYKTAIQKWNLDNDNEFRTWQGKAKNVELQNQALHWNKELDYQYAALGIQLTKAVDADTRRALTKQQAELRDGERLGRSALSMFGRAVSTKRPDQGQYFLTQARQLDADAFAKTGKHVLPEKVWQAPRGGNSDWELGFLGEDKPGPIGSATPAQALKTYNKLQADAAAGTPTAPTTTPPPPPAGTVQMLDPKTGRTGDVPTANVEAAKAKGLKVVQ
jgi:hypothetical protein